MLAETLTYLRAAFPRAQFPPETVTVYVEELKDLDDREVMEACRRIGRRALYLPTIGEIRREVAEARLGMPSAGVAWEIVLSGRPLREYEGTPLWEAYRAMGGKWELQNTANLGATRHAFERDYDQRRERALLAEMGALPAREALPPAGDPELETLVALSVDEPSTPVERRMARRFLGEKLVPPSDEEKADAIRVLRAGPDTPSPKGDAIYAEAERIFEEAGR